MKRSQIISLVGILAILIIILIGASFSKRFYSPDSATCNYDYVWATEDMIKKAAGDDPPTATRIRGCVPNPDCLKINGLDPLNSISNYPGLLTITKKSDTDYSFTCSICKESWFLKWCLCKLPDTPATPTPTTRPTGPTTRPS